MTITRDGGRGGFLGFEAAGAFLQSRDTDLVKEKICPLEEAECDPCTALMQKGHFDRINDAVFEMLKETDDFSREAIAKTE